MSESKHKHLDFIQAVISRMATNSFLLKGWSVSLVVAVIALERNNLSVLDGLAVGCAVLFFWILDSYYLYQERLYIELFNEVRRKAEADIDFEMRPISRRPGPEFWSSLWSATEILFYGPLGLIIGLVAALVG
jgi:hypothetical protein